VHEVLANVGGRPSISSFPALFSVGALLVSATAVFAELQWTLNRMWGVQAPQKRVIREFVRRRAYSVLMILAVGVLLLTSFVVSSLVVLVFGNGGAAARLFSLGGSVLVFSLAFAAVYKVLPDCWVSLRDSLVGGVLTGVLFSAGKELIGIYLGSSDVGSVYGTAGSLLVLLVWVYYSAVVFQFGAELTQAYANMFGDALVPHGRTRKAESSEKEESEHPSERVLEGSRSHPPV
jgi:membrane protein